VNASHTKKRGFVPPKGTDKERKQALCLLREQTKCVKKRGQRWEQTKCVKRSFDSHTKKRGFVPPKGTDKGTRKEALCLLREQTKKGKKRGFVPPKGTDKEGEQREPLPF